MICRPARADREYEFVPQRWQPVARRYPARIWRSGSKEQPVVALAEDGILIPRYDPKPAEMHVVN